MDRVNEVTAECFNALIQIRNLADDGHLAPEMFHQRLISFIDGVFIKGRQAGMQEHDVQDMAYALVALADELALRRPGGIRDVWMSNPLQLHYFNENVAGEGFFYRLEHIIRDPSRIDVLRVYYQCLLFGFLGKYAIRGGELELAAVTRRAQDALAGILRPEALSKRHLRPKERINRQRQGFLTIWIGLFALLFALALLIVLRVTLNSQTESQAERIETMVGG
ncbi:DotU family type IV/VI secretion system protein [Paraliomyxa miuraensis]|uniref:DotU family type IV/VI secretion system protein n=1 Tax=Paraliomyxa miuraensis TaxID=376150 RepID=UPI002259D5EA|nr:DotU family type IV/VI secretion system protein [Paraliomyxa miuraensis]MCX4243011.1 DotU family type IV/VI secretion system protein [Paraliomyxa miuraensis]